MKIIYKTLNRSKSYQQLYYFLNNKSNEKAEAIDGSNNPCSNKEVREMCSLSLAEAFLNLNWSPGRLALNLFFHSADRFLCGLTCRFRSKRMYVGLFDNTQCLCGFRSDCENSEFHCYYPLIIRTLKSIKNLFYVLSTLRTLFLHFPMNAIMNKSKTYASFVFICVKFF